MRVLDTLRAYESDRREIRARETRAPIIHQSSIAEKNPRRARGGGAGGAGAGSGRTSSGTSSCLAAANASATFAERGTGRGGSANRPVSREKTRWMVVSSTPRRRGRGLADTHRHVVPAERLVALLGAFPAPLAVAPLLALRAPRLARVHRTTPLALRREEKRARAFLHSELARTHDRTPKRSPRNAENRFLAEII